MQTQTKLQQLRHSPHLNRWKGVSMVLIGATCWGLSGTVAQTLFHDHGFVPGWLVTVRLILSGLLLLLLASAGSQRTKVWEIWRHPGHRIQLIIFGLLGMVAVQYTYFAAIDTGNAATATLLQYIAPVFITLYVAFQLWKRPKAKDGWAISFALFGTFLLVTGGSPGSLEITFEALTWGILSAVALAFYTLYPSRILKTWGATIVVGWGMLIGGIGLSLVYPPWEVSGQVWTWSTTLYVGFVILFGTLVAFYLYLDSMRFITATETSLVACAEPLAAVLASVVWLHVPFGAYEIVGGLCIIVTVTILSLQSKKTMPMETSTER
jgi:drug/metabolite transporter (DMT)-like permease